MGMIEVSWDQLRSFVVSRNLSIQWLDINDNYYLRAYDGQFGLSALIPKTDPAGDDQVDFETNFKDAGNKTPFNPVTTQTELRDKTLKIFSASAPVESDGTVTLLVRIPGTAGSGDGRWVQSGIGFFDVATPGDKITSIRFTDEDNISGAGAGTVVNSYTDDEAPSDNQGWYIPPNPGYARVESIGGYGFAPSGFYIKITGKKGGGVTTGTLYVNLEWAQSDSI
jgi:hypothetical protein